MSVPVMVTGTVLKNICLTNGLFKSTLIRLIQRVFKDFKEDQNFSSFWLLPSPPPFSNLSSLRSLPVCRRSTILTGEGMGKDQIVRQRVSTVLYKSFVTVWSHSFESKSGLNSKIFLFCDLAGFIRCSTGRVPTHKIKKAHCYPTCLPALPYCTYLKCRRYDAGLLVIKGGF